MALDFCFDFNSNTKVEGLNSLEVLVEKICYQNNIVNSYFGNILIASSELFHLLRCFDPNFSPTVYSINRKGAFVVGFEVQDLFLDVARLVQKELTSLIWLPSMNLPESCIVNVRMCADFVRLDEKQQSVELGFYLKSINPHQAKLRQKLVNDYIEGVYTSNIIN